MTQVVEMNQLKEVGVGLGSSPTWQINPWELVLAEKIVLGQSWAHARNSLSKGGEENVASMESVLVGADFRTLK